MATTLKQLARELNLDYSTVSYALSGKGTINEATRQRVREAAAAMGYVPNGLARRMRTNRTHGLGLVLPDSILLHNEFIQQIYRNAAARGYEVHIALTEFAVEAEDRAIRAMLEARMDGIVVRSRYGSWDEVPDGGALRQAATQRVPLITYGKRMEGSPFPALELPMGERCRMAAKHLLDQGHQRIAILLPVQLPIQWPHVSAINGVLEAMCARGLGEDNLNVVVLEPGEAEEEDDELDETYSNYLDEALPRRSVGRGRALLHRALALDPRPTALLCYNDVAAVGVLLEAAQLGLAIPGEMAVAAANRSLVAELAPLSLTTCDTLPGKVAEAALELLLDTMAGRCDEATVRGVEPVLRAGKSTVARERAGIRA